MIPIRAADNKNATVCKCELLKSRNAQLSTTLSCDLHLALVGLHLFVSLVDSCAFLNPTRELWSHKGCHNRIRHVDPPRPNLFQQVRLTQQARAHDPGPQRRQKMCNCLQMRNPGPLERVTVKDYEKLTCQNAQL